MLNNLFFSPDATFVTANPESITWVSLYGDKLSLKGIVHFEIKIWYLSAYPKGIQDVGVFFLQ